jgi:hypothetical protein
MCDLVQSASHPWRTGPATLFGLPLLTTPYLEVTEVERSLLLSLLCSPLQQNHHDLIQVTTPNFRQGMNEVMG